MLSMEEICRFGGTDIHRNNYKQGERILKSSENFFFCGKISNLDKNAEENAAEKDDENAEQMSIIAKCIGTSGLREDPHSIQGKIANNGKILSMLCSCKAGEGEKCKHVMATLLFIYNKGIENLTTLSCTDIECGWKKNWSNSLQQYEPTPISDHPAFKVKRFLYDVSESDRSKIRKIALQSEPDCAYSLSRLGRHEYKFNKSAQQYQVTDEVKTSLKEIISLSQADSKHDWLYRIKVSVSTNCCSHIFKELSSEPLQICEETFVNSKNWMKERKYRMTGSRIYGIFTYSSNKNPDWKKKSESYFNPKEFFSDYTEHGKLVEDEARTVYSEKINKKVVQCGLVVSKLNPWLAYSPDGVIFYDDKPEKLWEVKSVYKGKSVTILKAIDEEFKTCLVTTKKKELVFPLKMKKKHKYYAQVQLGMFILNINKASFSMYASFDRSIETIEIDYDSSFVENMLAIVKKTYYNIMLHTICDQSCKQNVIEGNTREM